MKLATLRDGSRDGELIVVNRSGSHFVRARSAAKTLQLALDDWDQVAPGLLELAHGVEDESTQREQIDMNQLLAPLPRAYEWIDGSTFINHVRLVRQARGAELPESMCSEPLVYQGGSGEFLASRAAIPLLDEAHGLDLEGEVCVVLADTKIGTDQSTADACIRLLMLANDVTLRNLIPAELAKGFGFFNSKPATAFSPFAITPDELGASFHEGRVHARLRCFVNERMLGDPDAGKEMSFSFYDLIAHIAKTRSFTAGTILGSGTVSNADPERGAACIVEQRARETIEQGAARTPYLRAGDRVRIEMRTPDGSNLFGSIDQVVISTKNKGEHVSA